MDKMQVAFRVKGLSVEKLLNEARKRGITLRGVGRMKGRAIAARCERKDYAALRALAEEKGYEISDPRPAGAFKRALLFKSRLGLAIGVLIGAALMLYALGFVWRVDIRGAGPYEGEVRSFLREQGILPGVRRDEMDQAALRDALEWRLPAVQRVRVEASGVTLVIHVDQGVPPPQVETEGGAGDVVAARDGLVTAVVTLAGTPQVKNGDFVRAGQVLIRGEEKGKNGETAPVKARGSVTARVWESARVRMPLTEWKTLPTGRETVCRVLEGPFFAYRYEETPPYLTYDAEISRLPLAGAWAPFSLRKEKYAEAALEIIPRDTAQTAREAEKAALQQLNERLKNAETVDKWINFRMIEGDTMVVEAAGELRTDIGRFRKNVP